MQKVCFVCLQPSRLKCSRCDAIQYCGTECQKKDWKIHKQNCRDNNTDGELHSKLNMIILNKAKNYSDQGNYHRSEKYLRKLLEPSIRAQHSSDFLFGCLRYLSITLNNQGKHLEAFEIAQESLDMCRSSLGDNHLRTLQSMNSLASSYIKHRKFNQAYELLNECIEKSTIIFGKDHNKTILYVTNLGDAYNYDGRHDEAQKLFRECLAMITNKDDELYVDIKCKLAISCMKTSQCEEAEKLLTESLEEMKLMKGENHPQTIYIMMNLANIYEQQNKPLDQIETIRKECLAKSIAIFGKDHINTLTALGYLAYSYIDKGKLYEAEQLFEECLEKMNRIYGENNSESTIIMMIHLAEVYEKQNKLDDVEVIRKECFAKSIVIFGKDHISTLIAMKSLADCYRNQGKLDEAAQFYKECLEKRISILGHDHIDTLSNMRILAETYQRQGQYDESIKLNQECLDRRKIILSENHPNTLNVMYDLGVNYEYKGELDEAVTLLKDCYEKRCIVLGEDHPDTMECAERVDCINKLMVNSKIN